MKRFICILLTICTLAMLYGCEEQQPNYKDPVSFYYPRIEYTYGSEDSVISYELRDASGHSADLYFVLCLYLDGPRSEHLVSPFPAGMRPISVSIEADEIYITLNDSVSELTGADLMLACACITKTCLELTGCSTVHIQGDNTLMDGFTVISMNAETILFLDNSTPQSSAPK